MISEVSISGVQSFAPILPGGPPDPAQTLNVPATPRMFGLERRKTNKHQHRKRKHDQVQALGRFYQLILYLFVKPSYKMVYKVFGTPGPGRYSLS